MNDKKLTLEELEYVQREVATHTKSIVAAYLFAIFLGFLGIHRAYFGKKKTAVLKGLITIFGGITLWQIMNIMSSIEPNAELSREILATNAAVAISFIGLLSIGILWYLADLFLVPRWKRKWDEKNRNKAASDVIQGRYVATQLLRDQLSEELVEDAKIKAVEKVEKILLTLDNEELHMLSEPSIPVLPEDEKDEKDEEELDESELDESIKPESVEHDDNIKLAEDTEQSDNDEQTQENNNDEVHSESAEKTELPEENSDAISSPEEQNDSLLQENK